MKNFVLVAFVMLAFATGCAKKEMGCAPVPPESEVAQIKAFTSANNISATKHGSGIYYQIIDSGRGSTPVNGSLITVKYIGKLLNNSTFDQSDSYSNYLGTLIEGWQIGIPLIKKGGEIKLIIPSTLGYGCNGSGRAVPPNSVLYFDIVLKDVQ